MNECPYCQNTFEMNETCSDEFKMWQGLQGPYYIPAVDAYGNLSWTNTGELPNPDPINITGKGLTIVGVVEDVSDLPESANDFDAYLVGETDNYQAYIWDGAAWVDIGLIRGPQGPAGPQVDPATAAPKMDGAAAVGTSTKYAREDHVHPNAVLQTYASFPIPSGSVTKTMAGITAKHVLVAWNFSTSAENTPPCDLTWSTANGSFTITKTKGTTSESIQPVFALPTAVAVS